MRADPSPLPSLRFAGRGQTASTRGAPIAAVLLLLALAAPARAATEQQQAAAKAAYAEGERSFELGKFEDAIAAYERAYALDAQPAFIYNIALAHRRQYDLDGKLDHLLRARELYRNYLRLDPASPRRAGVERILVELGAKIDEARRPPLASPAPAAAPSPAPPPVAPPPPPGARPPAVSPGADIRTPPPAPSKKGWYIAGAAAVVVGAAVAVLLISARSSDEPGDGPRIYLTPGP